MIIRRSDEYLIKLSLLSIVTPSNLNDSTTCTITPFTSISFGSLFFMCLLVTNIKKVFDQFISSLLNLHHSIKGSSFFLKLDISLSRSMSDSYKVVSSANILQISSIMNAKSFMKRRKKSGPRRLPCGTPNSKNDHFLFFE